MHSHIQLPKQILLQFRDENRSDKKVWFLDIPTGEIYCTSAKRLGTSFDYYSSSGEKFWDRAVEAPFGNLAKKVRMFCDDEGKSSVLTQEDIVAAKNYIKAAAVRSDLAYKTFFKNSFTAQFCAEQENHDALSVFGMQSDGTFNRLLDSWSPTIMVNETAKSFVVPRNCFYSVIFNGEEAVVAPISPRAALLFLPTEVYNDLGKGYAAVVDPNQVERLNLHALADEIYYNSAFVASNCREELEPLQQYLRENREDLKILKHQR